MAIDLSWLLSNELPQWFYWVTGGVQALGIIVSFLISYLGFKAYRITKEKKYQYFFYGFLFLGLSFLANLTLNILLRLGFASYFVEKRYDLFIAPFFGVYYFFLIGVLLAYLSLAIVYSGIQHPKKIWLLYFWTFLVGAYSFRESTLFNMFAAVLLSFVVVFTYDKYKENRNRGTFNTFLAFFSIFLFHLFALIESFSRMVIIVRYVLLVFGLAMLLYTLMKIHYGRTKK